MADEAAVTVYALCDDTGIRYIGQTRQPLKVRAWQHRFDLATGGAAKIAWIKALRASGQTPRVEVLEVVSAAEADEAERRHIDAARARGCALLNAKGALRGLRADEEREDKEEEPSAAQEQEGAPSAQQGAASPAALALRRVMEQISEEHWAAGWYSGLERILWRWMHCSTEGPLSWEERCMLGWLSEQAGGWWTWPKASPDPVFLSLEQWQSQRMQDHGGQHLQTHS